MQDSNRSQTVCTRVLRVTLPYSHARPNAALDESTSSPRPSGMCRPKLQR